MKSCFRFKSLLASAIFASLLQLTTTTVFSQSDDYNIKIGDLLIDFSVNVSYSYDDNVTTIPEGVPDRVDPTIIGPREDYIFGLGADVGLEWQISDNNTLGVILGFQRLDYQELDYLDSSNTFFNVGSDSEIDFTVLVGPMEFRIFDKFSYSVDGSNAALVDVVDDAEVVLDDNGRPIVRGRSISVEVDRYATWQNEFGIETMIILNPVEWTISLSRYDLIPDDDDGDEYVDELGRALETDRWEFTRRTEWIASTQLYYPLGRDNGFGVFGRFTVNDYAEDILADSHGWQVGGVADWALGDKTALSVTLGYNSRTWEEENTLRNTNGEFVDVLDSGTVFWAVEILHLLGDNFNHKLSYTQAVALGRVTNEQVVETLAWDFLFEGLRNVDFTGGVQFVSAEDSGPSQFAENYDLFMATLGFDIILTESLNTSIDYTYVDKDSDDDDRDFKRSTASISLHYDF